MPSLPSCSDYSTSIVVGSLVKASQLAGGKPEMYNGKPIKGAIFSLRQRLRTDIRATV